MRDHQICDMFIFGSTKVAGGLKVKLELFLDSLLFEKQVVVNYVSQDKIYNAKKKLMEDRYNNVYDVLDSIHEKIFRNKTSEPIFLALVEKFFVPTFCTKAVNISDKSEEFDR